MFTIKAANNAMLLWMDRGQTPNEFSFQAGIASSALSRHADVKSAVNEAMRKLADGSSANRQPWVLCEKVVIEPAEIQVINNQMANEVIDDHLAASPDAVRRYYAEWG